MSLRARMGIAAGVAVAVAVVAVTVSAYAGTRGELLGQTDNSLHTLVQPILIRAGVIKAPPGVGAGAFGQGPEGGSGAPGAFGGSAGARGAGARDGFTTSRNDCDHGLGLDATRGGGFGGPQGYVQLVSPAGSVCLATGETTKLPVTGSVKALARSGGGSFLTDASIGSTHLRVLVDSVGSRGAVEVALPLRDVDAALSSELLLLVIIAAAGIALAALLGILVARTALSPIARFTRQTEAIAANPERLDTERLEVRGGDELARLAQTFNRTLDTLERAVQAQRNLVADASHELRTPISTIRANLQLMRDERLLSAEDREALRADVIEELDELTALVGDVVELARGTKMDAEPGDVRLDEIVAAAVERARRRAPGMTVESIIQPTLVHGEGDRIARAVNNLCDNAIKYGERGGTIAVELRSGTLTVRDHGPGFHAEDLPFVFDRFHRARDARSKPGSGLGLAIVRQAAEAHGGFVDAANAPGGGALMTVGFGPAQALGDAAPPDRVGSA
ncbi:MAG: HAMP domain-containing sensor histidine kinase [Solirubrobacteraceae bacterium]|jgi:two-component system sensor histidine kinase MprB